jgi:heme-degrading monooxygenase HmoA
MIARMWSGAVRREDADAYADYILNTGLAEYAGTPGNRGAWMLRRDRGERTQFVTFSLWESLDAIRAFAGEDVDAAVFYPEDDRYLVERDTTVSHYEVAHEVRPRAGDQAAG